MAFLPVLYRIQEIETALNALEQREAAAKQDPNYQALKMLQQQLESSLVLLEKEMGQSNSSQRQMDLELKSCLEHIKVEEQKLYSGKTSSSRELEQIQQKMTEYQKSKDKYEEQLLELMEAAENFLTRQNEEKSRLEKCLQEMQANKKIINQKLLEIKLEKTDLEAELSDLVSQIPPEWLERYRKIAKSHRGIGIAKVKQNSCGGCHVSLSESLLQKIKRGNDQINFCENCGRILYY